MTGLPGADDGYHGLPPGFDTSVAHPAACTTTGWAGRTTSTPTGRPPRRSSLPGRRSSGTSATTARSSAGPSASWPPRRLRQFLDIGTGIRREQHARGRPVCPRPSQVVYAAHARSVRARPRAAGQHAGGGGAHLDADLKDMGKILQEVVGRARLRAAGRRPVPRGAAPCCRFRGPRRASIATAMAAVPARQLPGAHPARAHIDTEIAAEGARRYNQQATTPGDPRIRRRPCVLFYGPGRWSTPESCGTEKRVAAGSWRHRLASRFRMVRRRLQEMKSAAAELVGASATTIAAAKARSRIAASRRRVAGGENGSSSHRGTGRACGAGRGDFGRLVAEPDRATRRRVAAGGPQACRRNLPSVGQATSRPT